MVEDLYFCFCCVSVLPAIKCTLFSLPLQTRVRVLSDIRCINSKINLIDLAGSERLSKTGVSSGRNVSVQGWAGQSSTSWRWNCRAFHNRAQPVTQALLVYLLFIISPHREGPQPSALIRSSWFSSLFHEPQCKSAALGHSRQALRAETFLELSTDLHRSRWCSVLTTGEIPCYKYSLPPLWRKLADLVDLQWSLCKLMYSNWKELYITNWVGLNEIAIPFCSSNRNIYRGSFAFCFPLQSEGRVLKEAAYINKSLSFLEQIIIALADPKREHIPFRQSKLTHVLKDALGKSCGLHQRNRMHRK